MTPLGVLGLAPGATQAEIKAAYRKLALKCHPDRPGGSAASFKRLTLAYEDAMAGRIDPATGERGQAPPRHRYTQEEARRTFYTVFDQVFVSGGGRTFSSHTGRPWTLSAAEQKEARELMKNYSRKRRAA